MSIGKCIFRVANALKMHYKSRMYFCDYLKRLKLLNKLKSSKELFEFLGAEKTLKIKYRQFVQVEKGVSKPNTETLLASFKISTPIDYDLLIKSYFQSILIDVDRNNSKNLVDYIEASLSPGIARKSENALQTKQNNNVISEEKLKILNSDRLCLRIHEKVVLYDKISIKELSIEELKVLPKLIDAGIIKKEGSFIKPVFSFYRLPTKDNSTLRAVSEGNKYILSVLNNYISYEDDESQELSFASGLFEPEIANKIRERMIVFKKWIQESVSNETHDKLVPLFYIAFEKRLGKHQL